VSDTSVLALSSELDCFCSCQPRRRACESLACSFVQFVLGGLLLGKAFLWEAGM
jgi:hypothetical protein